MKIVISIIIWIIGAVLAVFAFLVSLFSVITLFSFDKQRKAVHVQWFWLADAIIGLSPYWNFHVNGLENIDKQKAYVIVANHQSLADIIVMHKTRMQFKWVAKEKVYKLPFIRGFLFLGKHVKLSRGTLGHIRKFYRETTDWLNKGISVLFFPEGTRSDTGKLGKFQNGAFKIAIKEKKPILPIFINGTRKVLPKGSWVINAKASGDLTVFPPIDTTNFHLSDITRLKNMVYSKFESKTL
ncbi:MAG: lysophospholipid acyltransferase family protein [Candidatus Omnitrophota bacterium]